MRVRSKPWAGPLMDGNPQLLTQADHAAQFKGQWQSKFAQPQRLQIEVGMGKGQFIIGMAQAHPQINFLGVEIQKSVAAIALKSALPLDLPNLHFIAGDGGNLTDYFADGEVDQLYLNFSDPWPKTRHEKRRLTYRSYLDVYKVIVKNKGRLEFKTDNMGLFEYSLTSLNNYGMQFEQVWLDLHNSSENEGNVETEYEQKFSALGQPIYKLAARFPEK